MASISSVVGSGRISRDDGYWNRWVNSGVGEPVSKALFPAKCNYIISSSFRQRRTPSFFSDTTSFSLSNLKLENSIVKQLHVPSAKEVKTAQIEAPEKPKVPAKAPAKAPAKPLPQMMEEDVIPSLKAILQNQDDLSDLDLFFQDNRLEGSFVKKGIPYSFWAFFPSGVLTGPKGFSLTSYGSEASTVEPFLIDEKKITAKHVVFWVEKRLAAQGIIPVWKD